MKKKSRGFSLIEMILALLIFSLLVAMALPVITVKRKTGGGDVKWQYSSNGADIHYCAGGNCNVGIGIANPDDKLDVDGYVDSTGYKVNGTEGVSGTCSSVVVENGIVVECTP